MRKAGVTRQHLESLLLRVTTWLSAPRVVLLSALAFVAAFWLVNVSGVPGLLRSEALGEVGILDMDYGYTPAQAHLKMEAYGPDGRAAYRQFLTRVDFVYPALVGFFLCSATMALVRRTSQARHRALVLALVPMVLTAADWTENAAILAQLGSYPEPLPWVARLASLLTLTKAGAGIVSLAVLLGLVMLVVIRKLQARALQGRPAGML